MQMSVSLTNQKQKIIRLLVSLRPANAANTDEGLESDFIIATQKTGGRGNERETRDREMERNVCKKKKKK